MLRWGGFESPVSKYWWSGSQDDEGEWGENSEGGAGAEEERGGGQYLLSIISCWTLFLQHHHRYILMLCIMLPCYHHWKRGRSLKEENSIKCFHSAFLIYKHRHDYHCSIMEEGRRPHHHEHRHVHHVKIYNSEPSSIWATKPDKGASTDWGCPQCLACTGWYQQKTTMMMTPMMTMLLIVSAWYYWWWEWYKITVAMMTMMIKFSVWPASFALQQISLT